METNKDLVKYREMMQKIIDKHLPPEKRFSVKNYSEEALYFLASLLHEKDKEKRNEIRKEISRRREEAFKRFQNSEKEFLLEDNTMHQKLAEYRTILDSFTPQQHLINDIQLIQNISNIDS
ncbi:hypothetical protein IJM86_08715 [bacterium]|nr:hypothetical protein [bacterium]